MRSGHEKPLNRLGPMQILLLEPDRPDSWPESLRAALVDARKWSVPWFNECPDRGGYYDQLHQLLTPEVRLHALRGWHCTRLRDAEVQTIRVEGLKVLSEELLLDRIEAAREANELSSAVAERLRTLHQGGQSNRTGQLWFGFSRDLPDEQAIKRLVRYWGGEAMYWAHEGNKSVFSELQRIGRPTIIDACVPVAGLKSTFELVDVICRADLRSAGLLSPYNVSIFEAYTTVPVPAENIIAIDQYPDAAFEQRTHCARWHEPLH